jgi:hypothetical protein
MFVENRFPKKMPRGIKYEKEGYVDILGACCGFLVTKKQCDTIFEDEAFFNPFDSHFFVDDVWISGFLTLHNISIYTIPNFTGVEEVRNKNDKISPLYDATRIQKNRDCILYFRNKYDIW